jgi:hypothetical protein
MVSPARKVTRQISINKGDAFLICHTLSLIYSASLVERVATTIEIGRMVQVWLGFILSLGDVLVKSIYPSTMARDFCSIVGGMLVEARHPSAMARVCCIYVVGLFLVGLI